jgi:hypothetical protein
MSIVKQTELGEKMNVFQAGEEARKTKEEQLYNSYQDFAYTNNPNKVSYFTGISFVKFGILCNASHDSAFVEGDLFSNYQDAENSLLELYDDLEEAEEEDNVIVLVYGEEQRFEDGEENIIIEDWEKIQ